MLTIALIIAANHCYFTPSVHKAFATGEATAEQTKKPNFKSALSGRAETFIVGEQRTCPTFYKELKINPCFKVKAGEKQVFSIWVKDPQGIKEVTATIETDNGKKKLDFKLAEGTEEKGRWEGSWRTKDISANKSYLTKFRAINKKGEDTVLGTFWHTK